MKSSVEIHVICVPTQKIKCRKVKANSRAELFSFFAETVTLTMINPKLPLDTSNPYTKFGINEPKKISYSAESEFLFYQKWH